jgi:hypothetical protein
LIALIVKEKPGIATLHRAWLHLDRLRATAFHLAGLLIHIT